MGEIRLFRINPDGVQELAGESVAVEKSLQSLLEKNLEAFLDIRFLASEYSTGKTHGGRIDTLGLDGDNCPVIIEYKRALNESVTNQVLYYFAWLMDHKAEFAQLVRKTLGEDASDHLEWSSPRLLCIAGDFAPYDRSAVEQISRRIELLRYKRYGDGLLLFELMNANQVSSRKGRLTQAADTTSQSKGAGDRLYRVNADGMHESSRRMETYRSILDGMPLADFKGNRGDLTKLLKNGQVKLG